jgi:hypothetical protein
MEQFIAAGFEPLPRQVYSADSIRVGATDLGGGDFALDVDVGHDGEPTLAQLNRCND